MAVSVTEFKAKCLKLMNDVARTRQPLVVTRHGRPLVQIRPVEADPSAHGLGCMAGQTEIVGDVIQVPDDDWFVDAPADSPETEAAEVPEEYDAT